MGEKTDTATSTTAALAPAAAPSPAPDAGVKRVAPVATEGGNSAGTLEDVKEKGTKPGTPGAASQGDGGGTTNMIMMIGGMVLLMYFFLIRPQRKREKAQASMQNQLDKGDTIMTHAGIIGEIVKLTDNDIVVRIDKRKDVQMRVRRAAIYGKVDAAGDDAEA
jgi:preprotein translocase subunit YajC